MRGRGAAFVEGEDSAVDDDDEMMSSKRVAGSGASAVISTRYSTADGKR